jgi:tRNA threonylcarbamoyladenosine biosynthesis protein TsaB
MLTLAVDTTADTGSIALAHEGLCLEEVVLHAPRGFSHVLFGEIEALLNRRSVSLSEIDLFAGASGPGSFTGVRVGLSAVKGLGEVLGKPVAAVSNLAALAEYGSTDRRAIVIDAHRGEIYGAVYGSVGQLIVPEIVTSFERFRDMLPPGEFEWISADPELIEQRAPDVRVLRAPRALAGVIARLAMRSRVSSDPVAIEANYVRRSDAELLFRG